MEYLLDVTPAEAVANGAQLLDERLPGWWREITLEELSLADCGACVCGQLAHTASVRAFDAYQFLNGYDRATTFLGLRWITMDRPDTIGADYEYGFNVKPYDAEFFGDWDPEEWHDTIERTYNALEAEWVLAITARLEADKLPTAPVETQEVLASC